MSILIMPRLIYIHLKMDSKQRPETDKDSSTEQKTWQVYSFLKFFFFEIWQQVQRGFLLERKEPNNADKAKPCSADIHSPAHTHAWKQHTETTHFKHIFTLCSLSISAQCPSIPASEATKSEWTWSSMENWSQWTNISMFQLTQFLAL